MNWLKRLKRRVLCEWADQHVGYPDRVGDRMMFYCTRCEQHALPISPERTEAISRMFIKEEDERRPPP